VTIRTPTRFTGAVLLLMTLGVMAVGTAGCSSSGSTSAAEAPLPTIGIGSDLSGAATIPGGRVADNSDVDSIVMIGDSITVASDMALKSKFSELGFSKVDIAAQVGKRMARTVGDNPSGVDVARFINSSMKGRADRQLWVVALGTNDVNQYSSPDEIAAAVDEILAQVPEGVPLVWVDTFYRDQSKGARVVNTVIADRLSRRGNAVMAPWSSSAAAKGVLRSDGIHPSTTGTKVFAEVVGSTIQQFLGR
jgi:lysophospholipase L1-like esterase